MPKLTEHQDRYDECVKSRLPKECRWFLDNQKGKHPIGNELKSEDANSLLVEHAIGCGYMLGMKPYLIHDELSVQLKNIGWRFEPTTKIPWYDKEKLKKNKEHGRHGCNPAKVVDTSKMIQGFGIKLNLVGWKIFCDMRYVDLVPLVEQGVPIEEIFRLPQKRKIDTTSRFISFGGKIYTTTQALRKAGIPRRSFDWKINHLAKELEISRKDVSNEDRQKIFDELLPMFNRGTERIGCWFTKGKVFICLSNADFSIVLQNANADNKSPDEWLHSILQSYSYQ